MNIIIVYALGGGPPALLSGRLYVGIMYILTYDVIQIYIIHIVLDVYWYEYRLRETAERRLNSIANSCLKYE